MKLARSKILWFCLKTLASWKLFLSKPEIVAITGSVGKSGTKEAIYQVLSGQFGPRVRKSAGNLNNEIGVPLAILGFQHSFRFWQWPFVLIWGLVKIIDRSKILILEMAADKPGDLAYLTSFIKPKIAVVTAAGNAHLEFFKTRQRIIQEKGRLISALSQGGKAVLNFDQKEVREMSKLTKNQILTFCCQTGADVQAGQIKEGLQGTDFQLRFQNQTVYQALAAVAVGLLYQIPLSLIVRHLKKLQPLKGRMNLLSCASGAKILDDSYNANPQSVIAGLDFLSKVRAKRKIAVLGDMLELGKESLKGHQEVEKRAQEVADLLITVGQKSQGGVHFPNNSQAIAFLKNEIKPGDLILIKASRAMKFEEIVESLKSQSN